MKDRAPWQPDLPPANELAAYRKTLGAKRDPNRTCVTVCGGTGCRACQGLDVAAAFRKAFQEHALEGKVDLRVTGCLGFCEHGPVVTLRPKGLIYVKVTAADAKEIVEKTVLRGEEVERLFIKDPQTKKRLRTREEIPFYKHQMPVIFGANFDLDPQSIDDYLHSGGYTALVKALTTMKPEQIIEEVTKSGLRGRGGAGFPTGPKWASCRKVESNGKYIVCNADEGDPGAYANRSLMEGNPHSVLEGMIIGSYAIGAHEGFIYVRAEYPLAVELLAKAIEDARALGLLGENILGTGHSFDLDINRGGGAFVCGESTALMASIEGRAGEPRAKHVHTVERGLWDRPTVLNNVETWSNIPLIVNRGAQWFTTIGTGDVSKGPWGGSKGTKIFSLVGKVNNTGLVEVPMGATLRQIIYDIGGGIKGGKKFKGVQTGGPSGGILGEQHLDLPIDYDQLVEVGSMMGSGGMIVMDERQLHGGFRPLLPRLPRRRILRQVHALPRGGRPNAAVAGADRRRQGYHGAPGFAPGPGRGGPGRLPLPVGHDCAQPGLDNPRLLPGGVRGAHSGRQVSRRCLQGPGRLRH